MAKSEKRKDKLIKERKAKGSKKDLINQAVICNVDDFTKKKLDRQKQKELKLDEKEIKRIEAKRMLLEEEENFKPINKHQPKFTRSMVTKPQDKVRPKVKYTQSEYFTDTHINYEHTNDKKVDDILNSLSELNLSKSVNVQKKPVNSKNEYEIIYSQYEKNELIRMGKEHPKMLINQLKMAIRKNWNLIKNDVIEIQY
ncbi:hypothetical protein A3Q56_02077 [Intoshia linei]|uniref:Coiled-coil domain-containing protein n=1 Tax=Intoshia linei TaxID=1819745 RepID=A0A177B9E8_9BILA|nr:hypothetical protein A3Q56_02077 [Intoshia linei]